MGDRLEYTVLTRLLTLNNQVHDLENQLMTESVPSLQNHRESVMTSIGNHQSDGNRESDADNKAVGANRIAEMQDRIAQGVRASLTTCWLGASDDLDF